MKPLNNFIKYYNNKEEKKISKDKKKGENEGGIEFSFYFIADIKLFKGRM